MKTIGAAVLGLGEMGATHVQAAKDSPWIDRIIGYEPSAPRAALRGEKLNIETTSDLDAILNDPGVDLVYIAGPNEVHCDQAVAAIRTGKAVLSEKPMGVNLDQATRMLEAQRETNGFLQIGLELRYSLLYLQVRQWIEEGLIGTPLNTHCDYSVVSFMAKVRGEVRVPRA